MPNNRRDLLLLLCLSLLVRSLVALLWTDPPYVDAYYYTVGAQRIVGGSGFNEPFIWHYLDNPIDVLHPGFLYWMPLPSILAAPFKALSIYAFDSSFWVVQLPFVLLSSVFPLVGYLVAQEITGSRRHAWIVGVLVLFSGFFFPFWTLPETFASFALLGSLVIWLSGKAQVRVGGVRFDTIRWLFIGVLIGLAHLTRADGILLLPIVFMSAYLPACLGRAGCDAKEGGWRNLATLAGYLIVMAPWFFRNFLVIGTPLSPAGTKTIWLCAYEDIACYGCDISLHSYLDCGMRNILASKLTALWINFQHFLAGNCQVFLCPFIVVGFYRLRRRRLVLLSGSYLLLLYFTHSLIFTFPGWRGSFFHSSGVLLPFLYAVGVEGLDVSLSWIARRRPWNLRMARKVFSTAVVSAAVLLSLYAVLPKLSSWRNPDMAYEHIGRWLSVRDTSPDVTVIVNNPPGFYYHTGRPSIVVPNGDVDMLLAVADRYGADYLVLDRNRPADLAALYMGEVSHSRLSPLSVWQIDSNRVVLYAVEAP